MCGTMGTASDRSIARPPSAGDMGGHTFSGGARIGVQVKEILGFTTLTCPKCPQPLSVCWGAAHSLCAPQTHTERNSLPLAQAGRAASSHLNRLGRFHNVSHGRRRGRRKCDIGTLPSILGPPSETSCLTATCLVSLCGFALDHGSMYRSLVLALPTTLVCAPSFPFLDLGQPLKPRAFVLSFANMSIPLTAFQGVVQGPRASPLLGVS